MEDYRATIEQGGGGRIARAAPRGFAKSTVTDLMFGLWCICYKKKHFILLVSDSLAQASSFLAGIISEIEENELLKEDFGEDLKPKIDGNGYWVKWTDTEIVTSSNIKVSAKGAGNKLRGLKHNQWRPDLIILDDIENDENVGTPDQRLKLFNWYVKALTKTGAPYTDIIVVGTILHYDSLLSKLLKNPAYNSKKYKAVISWSQSPLWSTWETMFCNMNDPNRTETALTYFNEHRDEMLAGTEVLWEAKHSYYDLMVMRVTDGKGAFDSEMQNDPINPDEAVFPPDIFRYYTDVDETKLDVYGACDPSLGKAGSDYSAIITIGKHKETGLMYLLEADLARRHPDQIIIDCCNKHLRYNYKKFGVETVAFQEFFKDVMQRVSAEQGVYLPIEGIKTTSNKELRIQKLQPFIKNGYLLFKQGEMQQLIDQFVYFGKISNDDGPDGVELCVSLIGQAKRIFIGGF